MSYANHTTRKKAGWVGAGWEVPLTYIQRNIQGTRTDTSNDTFELIIDGKKSNLVFVVSDGRYHTEIESYLKIEKKTGAPNDTGGYWTVTAKDGMKFRFGYNLDSENIVNSSDPLVPQYVWRWSLDRIRDTNGNTIYFTYSENPTPNDQGAVYLSKIEYNNDKKRKIEFLLENTDRPDMSLTVEQGSEVQLARRLSEIQLTVDGQLVKKFMLEYILNAAGDKSLLNKITKYGTDGTALPPEVYSYTTYTDPSNGEQTDLLTGITNELGGMISINYTISSSFPNTTLPYNYWLVSSITMNNGMTGPHATSSTSNIYYENGLYDQPSDEFRGFSKVTETRPDGSKVVHYFHQDNAKKGIEWKTETVSSAGDIYEAVESTWSESLTDGVYTVQLDRAEEYDYDGSPSNPKVTRTEYQNYDQYGNTGLVIDHGDITVTGDEVYSYLEFAYNPSLWIVDNVKHSYVTMTPGGAKKRDSWFYYDGAFNFDTQVPFKGNLTKTESWNDSGSNPVTIFQYDTYGNLIKTTDPLGRISEIHYDDVYHTFPVEVVNAKKQLTQSQYNPLTGQILSTTDPNGNTAQYQYDAFHRLVKAIAPYDSLSSPTVEIEYVINPSPPHTVITKRRETVGGNTLDSVQLVDGFGRPVQSRAEYEDPAKIIIEDIYYDIMGRQFKESNPYLADYSLSYSTPDTTIPAETDEFDLLGRITKTTNPDGTFSASSFDHWTVTTTDENSNTKTYTYSAHDNLTQVVERNGIEEYTTGYQYNPLGELLSITDHLGNTSTMGYDSLGRIITVDDVDLGLRSASYDLVGNKVSQTDARGITVNYQYDPLNRLTLINYPNDNDIYFVYDINTIGTVSSITDSLGTVSAKFDNRLRKTEETRTMDSYSWTTKWEYDSMDRVTKLTYPDGEEVTYTYTPQGLLGGIPSIISSLSYNAGSQITQQTYANSKVTIFTYHNLNERLTSINTPGVQDLSYTYDNVGNYKTVTDAIAGITETFDYDDLNRLTRAYDNAATGGYDTGYTYNAIGNMLTETNNKTSAVTQYTYGLGTATPHAVTGKSDQLPLVGSFILDNGKAYCTTQQITLDNISMGYPTEYMASEDANFAGAAWQPFSTAPTFALSSGYGTKTVYFKVRNANGESKVKNDNIEYLLDSDGDQTADIYDDDDDNDGIPDTADTDPLDPANATLDPDGDGLTNLQEYRNNTNPNLADSDGDGWNDYDEIFTYNTNPNEADTDGDGIDDPLDANPRNPYNDGFSENYSVKQWIFNAGGNIRRSSANYVVNDRVGSGFSKGAYEDTDGDGMPDSWEIANGMSPSDSSDALLDYDGDGLINLQEYLNNTNPNVVDSDGDGWSDYMEIYVHRTDPAKVDTDGDGVKDSLDPNSQSQYHYGVSENYSVRSGGFNAGGGSRAGTAYKSSDLIGFISRGIAVYNPSLITSPDSVDFSTVETGHSSAELISLENNSLNNIVMGTIVITGNDAFEFRKKSDTCSGRILSPSIRCTLEIELLPLTAGAKGAALNIPYNDGEIKNADVPVRGIAVVDTTPPDTIITTAPVNPTVETQATFHFISTESNSTFECRIDSEAYSSCITPSTYSSLAEGAHTFSVRAIDSAGNADQTPASYSWTTDTTSPVSAITQPSDGALIIGTAYTVGGTADDGAGTGIQKVEVTTDGGATWSTASGTISWSYVWTIAGDGAYNIISRATDNAGNVETAGTGLTVTAAVRQSSLVMINGRQISVDGNPFTIKGVGYAPTPIGDDPETGPPYSDYFTSDYSSIYDRDLPLLRQMGANTMRLWSWGPTADHLDFLDKAYNDGVNPIYVIAGFWINGGLDIDPASPTNVREELKAEFREMVAIHKNHPAILMWAIGNELNADWMYGGQLVDLFTLINEMAEEAHIEDNNHPVTTPLVDVNLINTITTYDASVPRLDIWGVNVYRGNTFGTLFNDYYSASTKPLVVLEYGIDAYDNVNGDEYENIGRPYQADYAGALWNEIIANSDVCIGGTIMAYSDEWWKGKYSTDTGCPDDDPLIHSTCGYTITSHPDGYSNEEWWGIMRTIDNGTNPDNMEPREVYYSLQSLWVDSDGDGIPDSEDNCIEVFNSDQRDTNSGEDDNTSLAGEQHYGNTCDPDFDNDGIVSIFDFNEWRKYAGQTVPPCPEDIDLNGDSFCWIQDFNIWRLYYGSPPGPGIGD